MVCCASLCEVPPISSMFFVVVGVNADGDECGHRVLHLETIRGRLQGVCEGFAASLRFLRCAGLQSCCMYGRGLTLSEMADLMYDGLVV